MRYVRLKSARMSLAVGACILLLGTRCAHGQPRYDLSDDLTPEKILKQFQVETDFESLVRAMRHQSPIVRQSAAFLLGESRNSAAAPVLRSVLDDDDHQVRIIAAISLQRHGDPVGLPIVRAALAESDPFVRLRAATALCQLNESIGNPMVEALLGNSSPLLRAAAVGALRDCDTFPDRVRLLSKMTSDPSEDVRIEAAAALSQIRDTTVIPILIQMLRDRSEVVRLSVNLYLERVTQLSQGFDYSAAEATREEGVARWIAWWERSKNDFEFR